VVAGGRWSLRDGAGERHIRAREGSPHGGCACLDLKQGAGVGAGVGTRWAVGTKCPNLRRHPSSRRKIM
jgi:hypothetical protein